MIEKSIGGVAHWWMSANGKNGEWGSPLRWTTDPNKARQYGTKEEAQYVIGKDLPDCTAIEHIWIEEKRHLINLDKREVV